MDDLIIANNITEDLLKAVKKHFNCDENMAKTIVISAELNGNVKYLSVMINYNLES